jgi:hypothetical protein
MMVFTVGQLLWHLSALHRFDELVDKFAAHCGVWVVVVETCRPGLRGHHVLAYSSLDDSPRWPSFPMGWHAEGPLDESGLMSFPLGLEQWVQTHGILLLDVAKYQQYHIPIESSRSWTNRNKQQFHNTKLQSDLASTTCWVWHPTLKQGWPVLTRIITRCHHRSNDT